MGRLWCESDLDVSAEGCVVQRCAAGPVRHIDVAEQWHEGLGTAHGLVGGGDVERRLPVLVPCVHVRRVLQQHLHRLLRMGGGKGGGEKGMDRGRGIREREGKKKKGIREIEW